MMMVVVVVMVLARGEDGREDGSHVELERLLVLVSQRDVEGRDCVWVVVVGVDGEGMVIVFGEDVQRAFVEKGRRHRRE